MFPFTKKLTTDNTDRERERVEIKCSELEAGLRESEEKFRKITESAQDAIIMMGADQRISFWNTAAERIFGYTAAEALDQEMHTLIAPPSAHDAFKRGFQHFRESGEGPVVGKVLEVAALRKSGEEFPVELSISATQIGGQWHAIGIIRDITERKREEKKHREWMIAMDAVTDPIFLHDPQFRVLRCNRAYQRCAGIPFEQIIGKPYYEIFPKNHAPMPSCLRAMEAVAQEEEELKISDTIYTSRSFSVRDEHANYLYSVHILEDITERKRWEKSLRESESQLQTIVENLTEGLAVSSLDGQLLHFNRAALDLHGFATLDECRQHLTKFADMFELSVMDGTVLPVNQWPLARVLHGETLRDVEVRVRHIQAGWWRIFNYGGTIVRDTSGQPLMAIVTISDITERKRAEMALQESEEKFRGIFESTLDGILLADAGSKHFAVSNPVICHMLGYTPEEITRLSVQDIHPEKDLPHIIEQFEKQLRGEIELAADIPVKRKDGSIFYADIKSSPVQFGGKTYLVGVFRDITERKKMEDAMVAHEAELKRLNQSLELERNELRGEKAKDEALLASIGEGMIATDEEGNIITINRAAEHMLGLKFSEVVGEKMAEAIPAIDENGKTIPPDERVVSIALATGHKTTTETTSYIRKNGSPIPVAITINPVMLDKKLIGTIGIFRDITKEKELEETRRDLLSLASHQLRTPLSGTKWLIETLIKGLHGPLTKGQKEYLGEIYKINERMTSLVHDMLSVLRMESGITPTKREIVSTNALLATLLETLGPAAKEKGVAIRITDSENYSIETDPVFLQNILEVLVSNAITYSKPGGEATVSIAKDHSELVFAIKDSGIGIPRDEQQPIFERFYRASNAKTFNTRGTGLGLYIASTLAKKIGASLSFESEVGKGSTFYVHIPYSQPEPLLENLTRV